VVRKQEGLLLWLVYTGHHLCQQLVHGKATAGGETTPLSDQRPQVGQVVRRHAQTLKREWISLVGMLPIGARSVRSETSIIHLGKVNVAQNMTRKALQLSQGVGSIPTYQLALTDGYSDHVCEVNKELVHASVLTLADLRTEQAVYRVTCSPVVGEIFAVHQAKGRTGTQCILNGHEFAYTCRTSGVVAGDNNEFLSDCHRAVTQRWIVQFFHLGVEIIHIYHGDYA